MEPKHINQQLQEHKEKQKKDVVKYPPETLIKLNEEILAKCDDCGRDILNDEVALMRYGIICFDCCKKRWGI